MYVYHIVGVCMYVYMYARSQTSLTSCTSLLLSSAGCYFLYICTMSCVQVSTTTRQFDSACACAPPSSGAQAANTWRYIFSMCWRLHIKCVCISLFIIFFLCIFLCFAFFHSVQFEVVNMC